MKRPLRIVGRATVWIAGAVLVVFALGAIALAFVLTSERGLQKLAELTPALTSGRLTFGAVSGTLIGATEWRDIVYADELGMSARLQRLQLRVRPGDLLLPRVHVTLLHAEGFELVLPERPTKPRLGPLTVLTHLPVDVVVESFILTRAKVEYARAAPFELDRVEVAGKWIGDELEITRLASVLPGIGAFELSARTRLHADSVAIESLAFRGPGEFSASGVFGIESARSDLTLRWRELRWPLAPQDALPTLTRVEGELKLSGPLDDYRYELTSRASAQDVPLQLESQGGGSLSELRIEALSLRADKGAAQLEGRIAWAAGVSADLEGRIAQFNPALFAPDWPGSINGTVQTRTTVRDGRPDIAFELRIDQSQLRGKTFAMTARGTTDARSVRLEDVLLRAANGTLSAKGDVAWSPSLTAHLDAELAQLDPAAFLPAWPGRLNGTLVVRTAMQAEQPAVNFDLRIDKSELRTYPLTLTTQGTWRAPVLTLDELALATGTTRLTASGQATPPFDLVAKIQSPDLVAVHPDLGGQLNADLRLQGSLERPHLVTKGSGIALRWQGNRLGKLEWSADVDPAVPSQIDITAVDGNFGWAMPRAALKANGAQSYHYVTFDAQTERGDLAVRFEGGYNRALNEWGGYWTTGRIAPDRLPEWKLEKSAPLLVGRQRQSLEPACFSGGSGRVCLRLEQNVTGQGLRLYWDLDQLQLASFQPLMPSDTEIHGKADGDGYIEIADNDIAAIEAGVALNGVRIQRPRMPVFEMLPSTIKVDQKDGRLHAVADLKLAQGFIKADIAAEPAASFTERALSGRIRVDIPDLGFVEHFSSQLRSTGGSAGGTLELAGTPAMPRLRGELALVDGHTRLVTPGIELKQVRLRLSGDGQGPLAVTGSMHSGEGALSLAGSVDPARAPPRADVTLKGENFQAVATPDARIWVTPDLRLVSDESGMHLDGTLTVPRAEITPRKGIGDEGVSVSSDQVMVGVEPGPERASLKFYSSVRVILGERVSFKGYGLTTELGGTVTIREEPLRDTSAQGALYLNKGRYKAYGQELNIETGRLIFDGGPVTKPAVDLYATRRPQSDVTVGVRVRGTLNRPQLSLQSDPPMPREQQLSWLVLGRPLDASSSSDRSALTQAALGLGLAGGDYFAQRLGKGVGLDTLTIGGPAGGSAVAADAGTIQGSQASLGRGAYQDQTQAAQLTLGKYLTPRLFVSYGVSLFQQGQTFRLTYDLGRGFKLQSEAGVASGADLIYTIER